MSSCELLLAPVACHHAGFVLRMPTAVTADLQGTKPRVHCHGLTLRTEGSTEYLRSLFSSASILGSWPWPLH
ncbi:hypothetical protein BDW66DRAFT_133601 [Aspergillus desertorum]